LEEDGAVMEPTAYNERDIEFLLEVHDVETENRAPGLAGDGFGGGVDDENQMGGKLGSEKATLVGPGGIAIGANPLFVVTGEIGFHPFGAFQGEKRHAAVPRPMTRQGDMEMGIDAAEKTEGTERRGLNILERKDTRRVFRKESSKGIISGPALFLAVGEGTSEGRQAANVDGEERHAACSLPERFQFFSKTPSAAPFPNLPNLPNPIPNFLSTPKNQSHPNSPKTNSIHPIPKHHQNHPPIGAGARGR